jgi:hypothetical protein
VDAAQATTTTATALKPWIFVDAKVVERVNFGSWDHVRLLYVSVVERKNSGYAAIY